MSLSRLCLLVIAMAATIMKPTSAWWTNSNSVSDETNTAQKQYGSARQEPNSPFDLDMDSDLYKDQKHISAMNALLPISNCAECRKVRYELRATNGCY